jgi:N-acetyl-alpha-D-glucosaminyl L-malate synthase BshA
MAELLKIGITCYPTFGGSGVVATELGLALAARGHEVHFITSRLPARLHSHIGADVSFHEVNVYSYALFRHEPYTLALAAKMAEVAETFGLDLLHVHYAIPHAISAHLAQEMLGGTVKVITTLHGTDITLVGSDPSLYKITRYAIDQADAVTAVSEWLRLETERQFEPSLPIHVIRNFIDTAQFTPQAAPNWSGRHHCGANLPTLIHVSNFRPLKHAPAAVDVFAQVIQHAPAKLLMVGDGPDLPGAVKRAKDLGVTEHVSFLGNREDVAYLLAASDILLLPSESESFGLAALEGMACGCAVIASNIGGLPELVQDGVQGYLCELGDVRAMAGKAVELLLDPARLQQVQSAARERAVSCFDVNIVVPEYLRLYNSVLAGSPPRHG